MRLPKFLQRSRSEPVSQADLAKWWGGESVWSGVDVNRTSSLGVSAVWACVRVIAETIASLPLILYRRTGDGKERATDHPLYDLMHIQPNPEMSAFQWRETKQGHVLLQGNGYSQKVHGKDGYAQELWPLDPERIRVIKSGGAIAYEYVNQNGQKTIMPREDVLHIAGLGYDGFKGYAVLDVHANSIGASIAADRFGQEFFANDARPGGYIKMPGRLKDEAAIKRLRESWVERYGKWGSKHSVGILEENAEFVPVAIPPEQAQFIETRKYGTADIARLFRVPPHLIGDLERATFSNIEHQSLEFVVHTIRPWLVRWEQALSIQLLPPQDRSTYFFEFLVDALLRGDVQARWTAYRTAREIGVLSANEIRAIENMNGMGPDGDVYFVPMNWTTTEKTIAAPAPDRTPGPETDAPADEPEPKAEPKRSHEYRSAMSRKKLADAYRSVIREAAQRVVHKEVRDVKEAARKYLSVRAMEDWRGWLQDYYRGELSPYIVKVMGPAFSALAEVVKSSVEDELDLNVASTPDLEKAIRGWIGAYSQRHGSYSMAVLETALRELGTSNPEDVLQEELDGWAEKRVDRIANGETVGAINCFARDFYRAAGILSLVWVSVGSDTCPYCSQLSGKTVGIEQDFAMPGDALIDESGKLLEVQRKCKTPPLHNGCVCQIAAVKQDRASPAREKRKVKRAIVNRDSSGNMVGVEIVEETQDGE